MDAMVVYDIKKLPPELQKLLDPGRRLPANVRFFEERFGYSDLAKQFLWGVILMPLGAVVLIVSLILFFHLDRSSPNYESMSNALFTAEIVGFLTIVGGFLLLTSLRSKFQIIRTQQKGLATRYGAFLRDDLLIYRSDDAIKVVPKTQFKGLSGRELQFEHEGQRKTILLPNKLVGANPETLEAAIRTWAS